MEVDVEADSNYAGSFPGSTSLIGFWRELNYWGKWDDNFRADEPTWSRLDDGPPHNMEFIVNQWNSISKNGLGPNWTEQKGYDAVRKLCGPSE